MSIATKGGDSGQTSLAGGRRVFKSDLRVESYGTIDELVAVLGFARSICQNSQIRERTEEIQRTLFRLSANLATPPESRNQPPAMAQSDVDHLTALVHAMESQEGMIADWSLPGSHPESAAYEMARTVCRRAERTVVRFVETGEFVAPELLAYLNRLSDLIWLFGRKIEMDAGVNSRLRTDTADGANWSKAW